MPEDRSVFNLPTPEPDQVLTYGDEPDQVIDFYEGDPQAPIVVLVHGGYWSVTHDRIHVRPLANALADAGYNVGLIEYRRVPGSPSVYLEDVIAASALLSSAAPIVLVGHSAGGHLALLAAREIDAPVLALAPIADLADAIAQNADDGAVPVFLGSTDPAAFDPMQFDTLAPCVLMHGSEDTLVPVEQSRTYAATHAHARLIEVPGIAHFELIDPFHDTYLVLRDALAALSTTIE